MEENLENCCMICDYMIESGLWETREPGGLPSLIGGANPPDERKEGMLMYVTYADLIQIGIFICALVGLCYKIFKGRK